jgi:amidase
MVSSRTSASWSSTRIRYCQRPCAPPSIACRSGWPRPMSRSGTTAPLVPDLAASARLYMRLLMPAFTANWPSDQYQQAQVAANALKPDDKSLAAERSRGAVESHRDWVAADRARVGLQQRWSELFREWDVVLCPPMPTLAFHHDHTMPYSVRHIEIDGTEYPYFDQLVWPGIATTPGLPATAMPIDRSETGLPIGVQIVGPYLEDRTPLAFAELERFTTLLNRKGFRIWREYDSRCWLGWRPASDGATTFQ